MEVFDPSYTERDSKFGFLALRKPRGCVIASRSILIILSDLRSHNRGSFIFAKKQILKHVQYKIFHYPTAEGEPGYHAFFYNECTTSKNNKVFRIAFGGRMMCIRIVGY
jgi:hypothetical protein